MKKMDKDGLLLCELQAKTFELSKELTSESSEIFIRRFMHSDISKILDNEQILETNLQAKDLIDRVEEQYGLSQYGSKKYTRDELYWIGYLYRYFVYTYGLTAKQAYKKIKPKELRELFLAYHTMDPAQAIERILEAKGLIRSEEEELARQFAIFRRIRMESEKEKQKG